MIAQSSKYTTHIQAVFHNYVYNQTSMIFHI